VLDELQLRSYVKTSGATGLHIFVPLLANRFSHDQVRLVAAAVAKMVVDRRPDIATVEHLVRNRKGMVYVDFGQNGRGRTIASVFASRPSRRPGFDPAHVGRATGVDRSPCVYHREHL
jgi:bifunctional non-homologous end joining protein LigD